LKLLEENIQKIFEDMGIGNDFLSRTPIVQKIIMDKYNYIKLRNFCTTKETVIRVNSQSTEWENVIASYSPTRDYNIEKNLKITPNLY
jgi:hypothetical protein